MPQLKFLTKEEVDKRSRTAGTKIDSSPAFQAVSIFEESDRARRHNNPGAHIWTPEMGDLYGAEKGDSFQDASGKTYNTARYPTLEKGEEASKFVINKVWETSEGDARKFASLYTGLPTESDTVVNLARMIEEEQNGGSVENGGFVERGILSAKEIEEKYGIKASTEEKEPVVEEEPPGSGILRSALTSEEPLLTSAQELLDEEEYTQDPMLKYLLEAHSVLERGMSGLTFGAYDALATILRGEEPMKPQTVVGTVAGAGAELAGFLVGPLQVSKAIWANRLVPTKVGLGGVAQIMKKSGVELGTASGLAEVIPSLMRDESVTEMAVNVSKSAGVGTIIGALFPALGVVPKKPLRIAVGLAVMDMIRSGTGEWFTIDDVVKGVIDGDIDRNELAERSFGYLMDIYFTNKVPSMGKQLKALDNMFTNDILKLDVVKTADEIVAVTKARIPKERPKFEFAEGAEAEAAKPMSERVGKKTALFREEDVRETKKGNWFYSVPRGEASAYEAKIENPLVVDATSRPNSPADIAFDMLATKSQKRKLDRMVKTEAERDAAEAYQEGVVATRAKLKGHDAVIYKRGEAKNGGDWVQYFGKKMPKPFKESPQPRGVEFTEEGVPIPPEVHKGEVIIDEVSGQRLIGTPESTISKLSQYLWFVEHALRNHPEGRRASGKIIEAVDEHLYDNNQDLTLFRVLKKPLDKGQRILVRKAMETLYKGDKDAIRRLENRDPSVYDAARELIDWFSLIREDAKQYKRDMYVKWLPKNLSLAFSDVLNGVPVKKVLKNRGVKAEDLLDVVKEYKKIDNWGLEDYITNIERGSYKFVDKDGHVVLVGVTKKDAIKKAKEYLKDNPDVRTLRLETGFTGGDLAQMMSRPQYWAVRGRLERALKDDISSMNKDLVKEALGKTIRIIPTQKFAGPMVRRKGVLAGEADIFDVLPAYSYAMRKKMSLDPVIADVRKSIDQYPKDVRDIILSQIEYAKGKYSLGNKIVDDMFRNRGWRPMAFSKGVGKVRWVTARLKLGYRPVAAFINLVDGQGRTWVKVGNKLFGRAVKLFNTKEGKRIIEENKKFLGMSLASEAGEITRAQAKITRPLGLFQKPEYPNRGVSLLANYLYAKENMKLPEVEAMEFARRAMRFQQVNYNIAALPRLLRGPGGKLLGQFKPYMFGSAQFISSLRGWEIPRYMALFGATAGPRGYIYLMRSLPILGVWAGWDRMEEWINKTIPKIGRGVVGLLDGDATAPAVLQFPGELWDWFGPFVSDAVTLFNEVVKPALEGEGYSWDDFREYGKGLAPAMYYWDQLIDSIVDEDGWVRDGKLNVYMEGGKVKVKTGGRKLYRVGSWWDRFLLAMAVPPIEKSKQDVTRRILNREEDVRRRKQRKVVDEMIEYITTQRPIPEDTMDMFVKLGVRPELIEETIQSREMTPEQRQIVKTRLIGRARVSEMYEGIK